MKKNHNNNQEVEKMEVNQTLFEFLVRDLHHEKKMLQDELNQRKKLELEEMKLLLSEKRRLDHKDSEMERISKKQTLESFVGAPVVVDLALDKELSIVAPISDFSATEVTLPPKPTTPPAPKPVVTKPTTPPAPKLAPPKPVVTKPTIPVPPKPTTPAPPKPTTPLPASPVEKGEEEEDGFVEVTIQGEKYQVSEDSQGKRKVIYKIFVDEDGDEQPGDRVGEYIENKPVFDAETTDSAEEEEEEEYESVTIFAKEYFQTNKKNSDIFEVVSDEDGDEQPGNVVGKWVEGKPVFLKRDPFLWQHGENEYFIQNHIDSIIYQNDNGKVGKRVGEFKEGLAIMDKKKFVKKG